LLIKQLTPNIVEPDNLVKRLEGLINGDNFKYFVAEDNNEVIGFAGLAWYHIPSKGLIAWVEEVVVDEKVRSKGIGKALMNKLLELAQELKCNRVKLTVKNPIAIELYKKLGFEITDSKVMIKKNY